MLFLRIFEAVIVILFLTGVGTQVILPIINRTRLFPFFRQNPPTAIDASIRSASEDVKSAEYELELERLRERAKNLREKVQR